MRKKYLNTLKVDNMSKISKKLKSDTGSTIIIALLFTMICVFVGGAVLTAATVNGGRLNGRREREQAILSQRSLASVLAGQLEQEPDPSKPRKVKLVLPIRENVISGNKEPVMPENPTALETAFFDAASDVYKNHTEASKIFTVTYPDGKTESCTVKCDKNYEVRISFGSQDEQQKLLYGDAQVELVLRGNVSANSISWDGCEIVKAVN